jgi:hypothetical protein
MGSNDFDKRRDEIRRSGDRIRRVAWVIMVLSWVVMAAIAVGGIYLLLHPEVIGEFVGRIIAGFEGARGHE